MCLQTGAAGAVAEEAGNGRLERGLREREEVCGEAHLPVLAEERAGEMEERPLQVGESDAPVDGEALTLVEDRHVRCVGRVAPVDPPERDHVDGRRLRLHHADLRGGRLSAQDDVAVQEERVERGAGDVTLRHVERVEEMPGVLDLVPVDDAVAEPQEDVLDLTADLRDEVVVATKDALPRQCHVDLLTGEAAVEVRALELCSAWPRPRFRGPRGGR